MTVKSQLLRTANSALMYFTLFGARGALNRAFCMWRRTNEFRAPIPHSSKRLILRLGTTDVAAFRHVFIDDEYGFLLARPPSTIVDAGANVGMSAVYFSLRYPAAKIIAIEPEPTNFDVLSKNAKLFPNIIPIHAALWSHEGAVAVQDGGDGHWGMRVGGTAASDSTIRAITLQALLEEQRLDYVDLLKVDVEGAECEIFGDPSSWIGRVGIICAEMHDRFRPGCSRIFASATAEFPIRWRRGELSCVARDGLILSVQ